MKRKFADSKSESIKLVKRRIRRACPSVLFYHNNNESECLIIQDCCDKCWNRILKMILSEERAEVFLLRKGAEMVRYHGLAGITFAKV